MAAFGTNMMGVSISCGPRATLSFGSIRSKPMLKEIGETIRERRKMLGVNQQTLADLAGVAVNTVVAIERGEGNPQLATLLTILDTLGLQADINLKQLEYESL